MSSAPGQGPRGGDEETRLPLRRRIAGRVLTEAIARVPGAWRLSRGRVSSFFAAAAPDWDERVKPEGAAHLAPLVDAVERLDLDPARILDVGTGTGAGALWLAKRFEDAEVLGIDVSAEMIELALAKPRDEQRLRFAVADVAEASAGGGRFDLIVHLNCPVVFADVAAALAPGGAVVVAASYGSRTPFYTSHSALRRGFRRAGLEVLGEGQAGDGSWFAAALGRLSPAG
ncbi:MAG: methyltransferase domain-containing protein [Solirubrobacterales bacterium]